VSAELLLIELMERRGKCRKKNKRVRKVSQPRAQSINANLGHLHKYQLESRDKDEPFKCPECGKIILYDSKNAIHASKPPKMSPMGGQTWLKNLKK
jgi:uncharacterized C2H2 Zn-finger protein